MKRPWAFICASEGATSKHLRNYCREVYLLGYLPVCPKLQDSQYLVLEDAMERSEYTAIVRDKLLRCPMLVVCSRNQDATTNAQIGLAQKYNRMKQFNKALHGGSFLVQWNAKGMRSAWGASIPFCVHPEKSALFDSKRWASGIRQKQSRHASCIHEATALMLKIHQQSNMAVCAAGRSLAAS